MNRKLVLASFLALLVGMLSVAFNVQNAKASGTIYIRPDGSIDPPDAPISTLDNVTYILTGNIDDSIIVERDNIIVDGSGYTVTGSGSGNGTAFTNRSNVTLRNMTIRNFYSGIYLYSSSNSTLSGNNLTANKGAGILFDSSNNSLLSGNNVAANNVNGIWLFYSSSNILSGNNVAANNGIGIYLQSSSNNSLSCNSVTNNSMGIWFVSSNSNVLSGNNITNNMIGIYLSSSSNNSLSFNNVTANNGIGNGAGILFDSSSNSNVLSGNNITNNMIGIYLQSSSNNSIFHNSFVTNANQTQTEDSNNTWDNGFPSGGNYWSNYTGTDANHDGIGDTPYIIDANNTDHYPLMASYAIPEFPSLLILPLFMIATLLAVIVYRKKHAKISLTL